MMLSPAMQAGQLGRKLPDDQLVYFRIRLDLPTMLAMDAVRHTHGLPRNFTPERLHVTLVPLGDIRLISEEVMRRIHLAAASLEAEPLPLMFHRLHGNLLKGKNMRAIKDFQHALVRRLESFDVPLLDYAFDPHATLAYTEWQQRNIPIDPIAWTANEFLLVNSIHGVGPELLGRWPLISRQGELPLRA